MEKVLVRGGRRFGSIDLWESGVEGAVNCVRRKVGT